MEVKALSGNYPSLETHQLKVGLSLNLGYLLFSEQDIIDFGIANDPQEIHINKEYAEKSVFKGLIACGAQPYVTAHKIAWIPLVKNTFICGLEINNWKFMLPIYPGQKIIVKLSIIHIYPLSDSKSAAITWRFEFSGITGQFFQSLEVKALHRV